MTSFLNKQPIGVIILLILSGEAIFILPFVLARIFGITFLDVFGLNNTELGECFSVYGIVALVSYLFGGSLADRFKPNSLMALALIMTALGGLYMSTFPSYSGLQFLFGYWGFTTIFLFWSAMIKATRVWGGVQHQGMAFGFLDGGRGLVAAGIGSIGVFIFSILVDADLSTNTLGERQAAFRLVVLTTSTIVAIVGILVFFFLKSSESPTTDDRLKITFEDVKKVAEMPSVILLMIIILCAYVGYKITDNFSLYASQVMAFNEVEAATIGTALLYLRPIVGVATGLLADRSNPSKLMIIGFFIMLLGSIVFGSGLITGNVTGLFFVSTFSTALGIYAVRVLYFAALEEGRIPLALTGTAVGLISFIGYTPDIFVGLIKGRLLDNNPGITGHQYVFLFLSGFAVIGLIATYYFRKTTKNIRPNNVVLPD